MLINIIQIIDPTITYVNGPMIVNKDKVIGEICRFKTLREIYWIINIL